MWAPTGPASPDASRTQDHGYLAGGNRPHARPHARHPQREGLPGAGRQARQSLERKCSPMTGIAKGTMDAQSVELRVALSLIHISEPTRRTPISYAVFCLKKKK